MWIRPPAFSPDGNAGAWFRARTHDGVREATTYRKLDAPESVGLLASVTLDAGDLSLTVAFRDGHEPVVALLGD